MICRLCLTTISEDTAVFLVDTGENHAETKLAKMIAKYFYLEINADDRISTSICQDCCEHLEDFHRFWTHVDKKQSTLRNEFLEIKCDVETADDNVLTMPQTDVLNDVENSDEIMLDLKNIPMIDCLSETVTVNCEEFGLRTKDEERLDEGDGEHMDMLATDSDNNSLDDDVPLQTLKIKANAKETISKRKKEIVRPKANPQHEKPKKTSKPKSDVDSIRTTCKKLNLEIIDNFMKLVCDLCKYEAVNYADLRQHFLTLHNRAPYVKCCKSTYHKPGRLVEHIKWHQNPRIYKCEICDKVLKSRICLQSHKELAHDQCRANLLYCSICKKGFRSQKCLDNHVERHKNDRTYSCEICQKIFATPQRVRRHIESIHEDIYPHICDTCGKKFKFKPSFERHLLEHQGIVEPAEQCDICGEWKKNKNALRVHRFRHETTNVECDTCGRICVSRTALWKHRKYAHKLEKNLRCEFCEKTFKETKNLEEHMAIHTGAQLYSCPHCSKECRSKANMYVHIKRYHVQEWIRSKMERSNDPNLKAQVCL